MRIIAGTQKGRRLHGPKGPGLRPTADRVKEALFSILGSRVAGSRFLDLYAGTGAIGIEALSRGAQHVTFVETNLTALRVLRANIAQCKLEASAEIQTCPAGKRFATFIEKEHGVEMPRLDLYPSYLKERVVVFDVAGLRPILDLRVHADVAGFFPILYVKFGPSVSLSADCSLAVVLDDGRVSLYRLPN